MNAYLVHHLLRTSAEAHPDGPAVVDRDRSITYADLEAQANRLGHLLVDLGVARGDRVGVYLDKSLESVVGIYGALKAGAAYVPFDPRAPVGRLAYIAENCGMRVLLSGREKARAWAELLGRGAPIQTIVTLNDSEAEAPEGTQVLGTRAFEDRADSPPMVWAIDRDLAYILYTSGSTGQPKGVMLSHRNALTFVDWTVELLRILPEDRLSSHAPFHFDLSVFDLFGAAAGGASVSLVPAEAVALPAEAARWIDRESISVWYSVPSALSMLLLHGGLKEGDLASLRAVVFAGEVFPTKYLRELMKLLPHAEFHNWYGPTETNVCTAYRVPPLPEDMTEPISIGSAISNMEVFVVTEEGRRVERGEVGELFVRGAGVMQGYWGDPERTARSLVPNPLGGELRDSVYRTGDLVAEQDDGNYQFLGRRDAQIKSRGYRIELGEIETALYAHPSVAECAVTAVPDDVITNRIVAYVVTRDEVGRTELIRFCEERIPRYMIPEVFEFREALPKTSTGKVDRQSLADARGGSEKR